MHVQNTNAQYSIDKRQTLDGLCFRIWILPTGSSLETPVFIVTSHSEKFSMREGKNTYCMYNICLWQYLKYLFQFSQIMVDANFFRAIWQRMHVRLFSLSSENGLLKLLPCATSNSVNAVPLSVTVETGHWIITSGFLRLYFSQGNKCCTCRLRCLVLALDVLPCALSTCITTRHTSTPTPITITILIIIILGIG